MHMLEILCALAISGCVLAGIVGAEYRAAKGMNAVMSALKGGRGAKMECRTHTDAHKRRWAECYIPVERSAPEARRFLLD